MYKGICDRLIEVKTLNNVTNKNATLISDSCTVINRALELYSKTDSFVITELGLTFLRKKYDSCQNMLVKTEFYFFPINNTFSNTTFNEMELDSEIVYFQNSFDFNKTRKNLSVVKTHRNITKIVIPNNSEQIILNYLLLLFLELFLIVLSF